MRIHHLPRYVALAALLLCQCAMAAEPPPSAESFFKDPKIADVAISPKGGYVSVLTRAADGGYLVAVIDTADPSKVTIAASSKTGKIEDIHWINENRLGFTLKQYSLEFVGNWDEFAADRDGKNQTHLISGDWRHQQTELGTHMKSRVLQADFAYFGPTDDGSDDIIVEHYAFDPVKHGVETTHLYRLNSRTGQLNGPLTLRQPPKVRRWLLGADGVPRVATTHDKGRCAVHYLAPGSEQWQEISNEPCYEQPFAPVMLDSAGALWVTAGHHGFSALTTFDVKTKQLAKEPLVSVEGFDFAGNLESIGPGRRVAGVHFLADAPGSAWFAPEMQAIHKKVNALLPHAANKLSCSRLCQDAPALLVTSQSDRQPPQYFIYQTASGKLVELGSARPAIKAAQMGYRDFERYAARDGRTIPVYITTPPGKASGPRPTVVLVHGGPNTRGASWQWDAEAQFLASRGYLVLQPEFRGSTGYGVEHFMAGWKQWGGTMQDDLADAVAWAVKKGWADPKRVAIMGGSYGGYAAMMGLIKHPDVFRCGVSFAGVSDIGLRFSVAESDATDDVLDHDLKTLVGDPVTDAAWFAANSPLANAARLKQPILIGHGGLDRRVPIVHATKLRNAVEQHNKQVEWVAYGDEWHGLYHEENRIDFYKRVEAFLGKYL